MECQPDQHGARHSRVMGTDQGLGKCGPAPGLWDMTKHYQTTTGSGAYGVGYQAPASVGVALGHRKYGRLVISSQNDSDLMYGPGVLWTAAHHRIPLLSVMRNNRAYHQEVMHLQRMANRYQRGVTAQSTSVGSKIEDPNIDYATVARGLGVYGEGPITNPNDLRPALQRAIEALEGGEPALVDVFSQPR
jgi:acetolactate synthase-1/2/3 large subunit